MSGPVPTEDVVLAVHGGAGPVRSGRLDPAHEQAAREGLERALRAGQDAAARGHGGLGAAVAAVGVLEDDVTFNAGRGAVYTTDATQELEAAVMTGADRQAGAVAGIRHVRNPVRAALLVHQRSEHVLLAGSPAEDLARDHGLEMVPASWFHAPERLRALLDTSEAVAHERSEHAAPEPGSAAPSSEGHAAEAGFRPDRAPEGGTVGAVARGTDGTLAAATSTGGMTAKAPGRIGDTPLIGAGTYADARVAVSATGTGERFVRAVAAHHVAALLAHAEASVDEAGAAVIDDVESLGGEGGLLALTAAGALALPFSTRLMHRGALTASGRLGVALYDHEQA